MISAFLKRRWWLTQNRILTTISSALIIPIILYTTIVSVLNNVIVHSIDEIPYEHWAFPGLIMIIATIGLFPLLYRDFFDLRIHRHILQPITLAPVTKLEIVFGIALTAIIESLSFVIIGMAVLIILMPNPLVWYQYLIILFYVVLYNGVIANAFITIGLVTDRVTMYMFAVLTFLMFILFGSGILVEFEFYPSSLGSLFVNLPTSALMRGLRSLLFFQRLDWLSLLYPLLVATAWFGLNGLLFKYKSKQ